ncbi:DNA binding protein [Phytophthora megakarya]|uniref:DNA binding protein n=1 Tax=Phytophthora megakarya TaxID=4795 RepID=A0A225W2P7_9STRA|nr:DNA binding protein [Phytophthora megakarya]
MFSSDQGGEFKNKKLDDFFRKNGIRALPTNAYTPEENCLVEKLNGKLMSKVRAIREAAYLPTCLWGEVLHYVVHVDNMSVTKALGNITPYQKPWGRILDLKNLKVCGCVVYYHIPKQKQKDKLQMRSKSAVFLGMAESVIGFRLLDLETGNVVDRRSVHFREDVAVGGDYEEILLAKRYFGKQTVVPRDVPLVLLPVKQVTAANIEFQYQSVDISDEME